MPILDGGELIYIYVTNDHGYVSLVISIFRSFPHSRFITGFVTRLTRRVPLAEHLSSSPVFSGVRVTRCLVLCVCFVDRCFSFSPFYFVHCVVCHSSFVHCVVCHSSFVHCVVCHSLICGFWLPLWYLQTLLITYIEDVESASFRYTQYKTFGTIQIFKKSGLWSDFLFEGLSSDYLHFALYEQVFKPVRRQ